MRMRRTPESVDVWRDYRAPEPYSISVCDAEGEIRCLGGGTLEDAWDQAVDAAETLGVPARQVANSGEVVRTYTPEPRGSEEQP